MENMDDLQMLRNFLYVSIISADNDRYTEEQKQEIIRRHKEFEGKEPNWGYILEPIDNMGKLLELFEG